MTGRAGYSKPWASDKNRIISHSKRMTGNKYAVGNKWDEKRRKRQAKIAARVNARLQTKTSSLEIKLNDYLTTVGGFDLIPHVRFGRYVVDLYDPILHLAYEADGWYWHNLPGSEEKDLKRDMNLLSQFDLPVIRYSEEEIRRWDY